MKLSYNAVFVFAAFLLVGSLVIAAEGPKKYPACHVAKTEEIYFRSYREKDVLAASINGNPCYEAILNITIKTRGGRHLYLYEAPFKPHVAIHWEDLRVPKDPQDFLNFLFKEGMKRRQDLPPFISDEDFAERYNNRLEVGQKSYERLRRAQKPMFWHLTHYEAWRYVVYDEKEQKGIVVASGGL